jgi:NTP pyrophosphatase (non-canonical NTP hydrolase)
MNLEELQKEAVGLIAKYDTENRIKHDSNLTLIHLIEEFGELARELYNDQSGRDTLDRKNLGGEIADIYLLLARLAKIYNISLEDAISGKIKELKER